MSKPKRTPSKAGAFVNFRNTFSSNNPERCLSTEAKYLRSIRAEFRKSFQSRLVVDGVWAFSGKSLGAAVGIVTNGFLARLLTPESLGIYFLTLSVVSVLAVLAQGGLNQAVVRLIAEPVGIGRMDRACAAAKAAFTLGMIGALSVAALFVFGLGNWLASAVFHSPGMAGVVGIAAIWIVSLALQGLQAEIFRGFRDIRAASVFGGLFGGILSAIMLGALWVSYSRCELEWAVVVTVGAGVVSIAVAHLVLTTKFGKFTRSERPKSQAMLYMAWPMLVTNLTLFFLTQADLWVVGVLRPHDEVAIYGAAARLAALVALPLLVVNAVVPPVIAQYFSQQRKPDLERMLRTAATWAAVPAMVAAGIFLIEGKWLLGLFFGSYYESGALVLAILSVGQLVNVWTGACGFTLVMTGHQHVMMCISVASGLLMLSCALAVAPLYGAVGVASVAAGFIVLQNLLLLIATKRLVGIWTHGSVAHITSHRGMATP